MTPHDIEIVPLEITDGELLSALVSEVRRTFALPCRIGAVERLPASALDANRGQYHATRILEYLDASGKGTFRRLGVTAVDLFTAIMQYVFGEAVLDGKSALVSVSRLATSSRKDQPDDRATFLRRVLKEGIHELGHTFGLTHCEDPACVMSASLDTARIDAKSTALCSYCRVALEDAFERTGVSR